MVQQADHLFFLPGESVQPQLAQPQLRIGRSLQRIRFQIRIVDVIIIDARGLHRQLRMLLLLQLHSRIQIDHQLELQPAVQRLQVQSSLAGLVIDHPHIELSLRFTDVQPVDAPPETDLLLF